MRIRFLYILLILSIALKVEAAGLADVLTETDPKYRIVRTVFDRLSRTGSRVPPKLYVVRSDSKDNPIITNLGNDPLSRIRVSEEGKYVAIDESLVDLMSGLGSVTERDNGLAFLLGHELAHYTAWQSGSFSGGLQNGVVRRQSEIQADRLGSWYALEAGYDPFPAAELAIKSVYRHYHGGQTKLDGYPTLNERISVINRVRDEMSQKAPFFEAATLLLAVNYPQESARLFEHLARDFQGREILTNAGVANALAALAMPPKSPFFYPFEFETSYRYPLKVRSGFGNREKQRTALLEMAAGFFDKVLLLAPDYAAGHLNRAAVAELQKNRNKMEYHLNEAEDLAKAENDLIAGARVKIMRGIALANSAKNDDAALCFREALPHVKQMAITNLLALGLKPDLPFTATLSSTSVPELIGNHSPVNPLDAALIPLLGVSELHDTYDTPVKIYRKRTRDWDGMRLQIGTLSLISFSTPDRYTGESARGIKIGDHRDQLVMLYGHPVRIISSRRESLYIYAFNRLIVRLGSDDKITGWSVYHTEVKREEFN